ncbi:helix-turn-helix transcriptional regulator [Halomontanus rarus]|uniref:helix-turn-helix transcriptional regulator n=1 Tax=Halomontanus rarus TaxID=3034020 RepID=UPI003CE4C38B
MAIASQTADEGQFLLQTEQRPHLAALIGIIALAVLGGTLVVRNRLESRTGIERDRQPTGNEDFMTDRERVRELVTENGGRMKQADIVDSVEWSKAKVSRLLADLESEDEITKLRLGRENLICLRGQEPPASQSPDGSGSE